jgi:hypothetical protein
LPSTVIGSTPAGATFDFQSAPSDAVMAGVMSMAPGANCDTPPFNDPGATLKTSGPLDDVRAGPSTES